MYLRLLLLCAATACAQDPFEIHVYEFEPLRLGSFTYEAHVNSALRGPTQHQLHVTSEVTAGLSESFAIGALVLTAVRPDNLPAEYAGWRIVPHVFAPKSWNLPVNLGFLAEFSFERPAFEESSKHVELRLVVEKHIGRLELDGNPTFAHSLGGAGGNSGWEFEPAGRVGWHATSRFTPSVEYYSAWGPLANLPGLHDQVHQIVPGGDFKINDHLLWNFGLGVGFGDRADRALVKFRLEWEFDRARRGSGS